MDLWYIYIYFGGQDTISINEMSINIYLGYYSNFDF